MKTYTLDEMKDNFIGHWETPKRNAYELKLIDKASK